MNHFEKNLIHRLEGMGMETGIIPGFIRNLGNIILLNSSLTLFQINKRMQLLGWDGFELDYHTWQLAIACLEAEGLEDLEYIPPRWFETDANQPDTEINGGHLS